MVLMGKSTISIAIFNSYVKLPEGNTYGLTLPNNSGNSHSIMDELLLMDYGLTTATKNI